MKPFRRVALWYARVRYRRVPEPLQVWKEHGGVFWAWSLEEMIVERTWRYLPVNVRYLAEIQASRVVGCPWCIDFGYYLGEKSGMTEAKLRDLDRWRDSDAFDNDERLAIEYADNLSQTPMVLDEVLAKQIRERFGKKGIVEMTALIAIENQRSRFNHAMGLMSQGWSRTCPVEP